MNQNHTYIPPIQAKRAATRQDEKWDEAIAQLAIKADDLDDMFVNDFGAKMTHYSKC